MGSISGQGETTVLARPAEEKQATPAARTAAGLGYQPALDGLRGLSVLAIMAYHAQVPGGSGAFLGVSTFFTLSGFLITTIMLADYNRTGAVKIRGFYARRARRLMPAAVVTILAVTLITLLIGTATQLIRLRGDALAALLYVANWHQILAGDSYGNIFTNASPFVHFWSLAIEEQFYLAFPVAVALALWFGRGRRHLLVAGIALATVASIAWSAHLYNGGAGVDRIYFGTDTRLPELAIGSLTALWWWRRDRRPAAAAVAGIGTGAAGNGNGAGSGGNGSSRNGAGGNGSGGHGAASLSPAAPPAVVARLLPIAGIVALVAMVFLWHRVSRTSATLYHGGLAGYAVLSVIVVLAAIQPRGLVHGALSWRPLVWIGTVSYAAYLVHWPIMAVLRQETTLPWEGIAVVGVGVTLLIAWASKWVLERPIRTGVWPPPSRAPFYALAAITTTAVFIMAATAWRQVPSGTATLATTNLQAHADHLAQLGTPPEADAATLKARLVRDKHLTPEQKAAMSSYYDTQDRIAQSNAPRVAFFGDSSAVMTGVGVTGWAIDHLDKLAPSPGRADLGCGLIETGKRKVGNESAPPPSYCVGWVDHWIEDVSKYHVDVAVVQLGPWDVRAQQINPGDPYMTLGKDPELAQAMEDRLDKAVNRLLAHVQVVELVSPPNLEFGREDGESPKRAQPDSDPSRMAAFRTIVAEVAARHPRVAMVDLAGYLNTRHDDNTLRPDGVHFTDAASREVANWLGPQILWLYTMQGGTPQTRGPHSNALSAGPPPGLGPQPGAATTTVPGGSG